MIMRARSIGITFALVLAFDASATTAAAAKPRGPTAVRAAAPPRAAGSKRPAPARATPAPASTTPAPSTPAPATTSTTKGPPPSTPAPTSSGRTPPPAGASGAGSTTPPTGAESPSSGDGDVTRYQFTGLDIEGELRTPALLQFLSRIGGEFETVGIPHRSFMPELSQTVTEDAL
jgi:hypothetical protein